MEIPTREEWQNIPGKSARREALINLRRHVSDKDIREAWGMKAQTWYSLVTRYVGPSSGLPPEERQRGKKRGRPKGSVNSRSEEDDEEDNFADFSQKREFQDPVSEVNSSIPSDHRWPRKNVVEAEFEIVDDEQKPQHETGGASESDKKSLERMFFDRLGLAAEQQPPIGLPFPTIKGIPAQLRKQFEGVALFLEGLEDEFTRYEIRLSVVKADDEEKRPQ